MAGVLDLKRNHLLSMLPEAVRTLMQPDLEWVQLAQGQVLYEPLSPLIHAYFPTTSVVSLLHVLENGAAPEIASIGREGVVGMPLFMGGDAMRCRVVVVSAGNALRLPASAAKGEFIRSPAVMDLLQRYAQALMTQMGQTMVCNRHHSLMQQLSRWLLLYLDRLPGEELRMTQEMIANLLGVRREAISEVALKLQEAGVIRYSRGHIVVLDRSALEQRACECYAVVRGDYQRLLCHDVVLAKLSSLVR